jgi:hypothetical protein
MAKGKRKKHRKGGKITFGRTMAAGGEFTSSVGVVISWIIGILMALTGIYLILVGSFGRFDIFDGGQCSSPFGNAPTCDGKTAPCPGTKCSNINGICTWDDPCGGKSESSCKSDSDCTYSSSGTYSTGVRVMYIIGGLLTILFGVGIIMLSYWFRRAVHRNRNMAAFAGGLGIINAAGAAFGPRN